MTGTCSQTPTVRDAGRADLPQILAIYNEVIRNTTAVYSEVEFTPARGEAWFAAKAQRGFPFIVALEACGVVGIRHLRRFPRLAVLSHSASNTACMCAPTAAAAASAGRCCSP